MEPKTTKIILFALFLSCVLGIGGYFGYHRYEKWRQTTLNQQARDYLAKADYLNASLCLQSSLGHNGNNLETCRLMADYAESVSSPYALAWRSKIAELNPGALDDELLLAQAAIKVRDFATAARALSAVNPDGKRTAAYHEVAGAMAAALNQTAQAEEHFLEAARLEPANQLPLVNIAVVHLQGTNAAELARARIFLQHMAFDSTQPALSCLALRELTADAMRYRQADVALDLSEKLLNQTNSIFHDRLLRLDVLIDTRNGAFRPTLARCEKEAGTNVANITELAAWQMSKNLANDAVVWLESLPRNVRTNQSVALTSAECYAVIGDWHALQSQIEGQNWGDLEFMRFAFDSLALRKEDLSVSAVGEWKLAMSAAHGSKQRLNILTRLAIEWNWDEESEEALAAVVNLDPYDIGAFQALSKVLFARGHTRSLMLLYSDKSQREPWNLAARNNLAWTALLLNAQEMLPDYVAGEIYQKAPTNSAFTSTYALSLLMQNKHAQALQVFEKLDPRELENPSIAGCYGMVLVANGNEAKARKYLDLGSQSPMLPEQRDLIDAAKRGVVFSNRDGRGKLP